MKIGILTYHAACNFGANLQALSTVNYLKNHGLDPVIINYLNDDLEYYYQTNTPADQYKMHSHFRNQYFPMTQRCRTTEEVARIIEAEKFDAVIIGSDAVMQHHPLLSRIVFPCSRIFYVYKPTLDKMCPNPFWGAFLPLLKKTIPIFMMSASSQNSAYKQLTYRERKMLKNHLNQFSLITVRDDWTSQMVSNITNGTMVPEITPDPVFAFNYNVLNQPTEKEIRIKFGIKGKYYLISFHNSSTVSVEWLKELEFIANEKNIECIALPFPQGIEFNHPFTKHIPIPLSPLDWYGLIKYSEGYIGHNMHPIVIALHNAVPCFSFDQYGIVKYRLFTNEKSSKIYHIMHEFGVENNRVSDIGLRRRIPTPKHVIEMLDNFDKKSVAEHARFYLERYKKMMSQILQTIEQ